jgi:CheY-like chemotaxis protein
MSEHTGDNLDEDPIAGASIGALAIRALLRRLGYANSKHSGVLCELTGLSKPQIGRRLNGKSQWVLDDFAQVCSKLGADYIEVLEAVTEHAFLSATFKVGTETFPCFIRLGSEVGSGKAPRLTAVEEDRGWVVSQGHCSSFSHAVERLVLNLEDQPPRPKIAVFDDNVDACDSLCDTLAIHGLDTVGFYSLADFEHAWKTSRFDGFVIDWLIPGGDTGSALSTLRDLHPDAPIAVLTGMDTRSQGNAANLAKAIAETGAVYFAKPVPTAILAAALRSSASEPRASRQRQDRS